tara:strand:+ start:2076 stop:2288 length:213 start_codon:yes stop_codon:yes gene_type:complete
MFGTNAPVHRVPVNFQMGVEMINRTIFAILFAVAVLFDGSESSAQIIEVEDDFGNRRAYFGMTTRDTGLM